MAGIFVEARPHHRVEKIRARVVDERDRANRIAPRADRPHDVFQVHDVNVVVNHKFTDKFNSYVQLDYGHEDNAFLSDATTQTANADWYAAGLWLVYDFTDKVELAFRQDYLKDKDGVRTGSTFGLPAGIGPELYSSTLTLNYKPIANVQIRPEFRWDHSDKEAFNGIKDQFTLGMGVAYLF